MADASPTRRVIVVAPSFAPAGNPPTQRVRFFARHLPSYGWEPLVLSVDPEYYEETADPDIERLIPAGLMIERVRALPARLTRRVGLGDLGIRAYSHLSRRLSELCRTWRPDAILIPGPPWHTFRLGPTMLRTHGIPYVLDYIDPWINSMGADGRWWTKAYWYRRSAIALEPRAVHDAAQLVAVSEGTLRGIRELYPDVSGERCTAIPYGAEPADFEALQGRATTVRLWDDDGDALHIVYTGAMLPHGYETLRAFFGGLLALRETNPRLGTRVRVHFFGTTYDPRAHRPLVTPVAREMGLEGVVTEHPARIPYLDSLQSMATADVILALGSTEHHYTASKIYPSIFSRRPVLAVFHAASSVCDVMRQVEAGELVTYDDARRAETKTREIARALENLLTLPAQYASRVRWDAAREWTAESMTSRLAQVLFRAAPHEQRLQTRRNEPALST